LLSVVYTRETTAIRKIEFRERTAMSEKIGYSDDEKLGGEFIGIRY